MRVLQVIGAMDRGGAETMIMNAYRFADRDKVQFDFLVHEQRECDYDAEIEALGGRVYRELPRFTGLNGGAYRRTVRDFLARHLEHSVVHGHIGSSAAIYLGEAKRAGRVAVAHSHAQNYPLSPGELAFRALSLPVRFKADYFLACSRQAGLDRFGRIAVEGERFHVLRNGIDVEAFACTDGQHAEAKRSLLGRMGLTSDEALLVGHVGRFDSVKNHPLLVESFALMKEAAPGAHLVLVGRGPEEAAVRELVRERGLDGCVHFLGVTDDVPAVLRGLDVFALPSFREGLSMAAVEAQAAGVPCVLSEGVPAEAVLEGEACVSAAPGVVMLSPKADPRIWADALLRAAYRSAFGGIDRALGAQAARSAGFGIRDTARWLQEFYLRIE